MEQKFEEREEPSSPQTGIWMPWIEQEDVLAAPEPPTAEEQTQEELRTPPIIPPLPSGQILPPAYYAPTELNLRLSQLGQDSRLREACLIGFWACLTPLLTIAILVALGSGQGWAALGTGTLLAFLLHYNRLVDALNQTRGALSLSGFGKEWVGGLVEALFWPNSRIQGIAAASLTQMLPRLTPEDASLLSMQHREILYSRLNGVGAKTEFRIAILRALAAVGDAYSIPYMERIADSTAWTKTQAQVRSVARQSLAILEERLTRQKLTAPAPSAVLPAIPLAPAPVKAEISPEEQALRSRKVDELLEKLAEESRSRRQPAMRIGFLIANWAVIVPYLGINAIHSLAIGNPWYGTLIWALACAGSTQLYRFTLSSTLSKTARELAATDDIRAVSALAEALDWPDADIQYASRQALERLLPQLRATDSKLLNEKQRASLYKSLKMSNAHKEERLIIAILAALQQVGDTAAVPYVERLAQAKPRLPREQRIQRAAAECLPYLLIRAQDNESSAMLLRASSAVEMSPEILLRPASAHDSEAAEELLRPSSDSLQ